MTMLTQSTEAAVTCSQNSQDLTVNLSGLLRGSAQYHNRLCAEWCSCGEGRQLLVLGLCLLGICHQRTDIWDNISGSSCQEGYACCAAEACPPGHQEPSYAVQAT